MFNVYFNYYYFFLIKLFLQNSENNAKMLTVASLRDFDVPNFSNKASVGLIQECPIYGGKQESLDEMQSFFMYIKDLPSVNITQDMLTTRESARMVGAENLFLPVQDNVFKKIVSIWRERGFIEAARSAAAERREHLLLPIHWAAVQLILFLNLKRVFWKCNETTYKRN